MSREINLGCILRYMYIVFNYKLHVLQWRSLAVFDFLTKCKIVIMGLRYPARNEIGNHRQTPPVFGNGSLQHRLTSVFAECHVTSCLR